MDKQFLGDRVEMYTQIHILGLQDIKHPRVTSSGSIGIFIFFLFDFNWLKWSDIWRSSGGCCRMLHNIVMEMGRGTVHETPKRNLLPWQRLHLASRRRVNHEALWSVCLTALFAHKTHSFPVIKHLLQNNQRDPAPGLLSVHSNSARRTC